MPRRITSGKDMVLRVLKGNEERNSLSGKEDARPDGDVGRKIGYNGEVLAGALHKGWRSESRRIPWEVLIDPVSTLVATIQWRPGWCYHVEIR